MRIVCTVPPKSLSLPALPSSTAGPAPAEIMSSPSPPSTTSGIATLPARCAVLLSGPSQDTLDFGRRKSTARLAQKARVDLDQAVALLVDVHVSSPLVPTISSTPPRRLA